MTDADNKIPKTLWKFSWGIDAEKLFQDAPLTQVLARLKVLGITSNTTPSSGVYQNNLHKFTL
jgi:hypothetical protein